MGEDAIAVKLTCAQGNFQALHAQARLNTSISLLLGARANVNSK